MSGDREMRLDLAFPRLHSWPILTTLHGGCSHDCNERRPAEVNLESRDLERW